MKSFARHLLFSLVLILGGLFHVPQTACAVIPINDDIDKQMSGCLDEVEYKKYLELQKEYRGLLDPHHVKISDQYTLTDVVKQDKGKEICNMRDLPMFIDALCKVRDLVDACEDARKINLRHQLGKLYADYIRDHRYLYDQGLDPIPADSNPVIIRHNPWLKNEHGKEEEIIQMFQRGMQEYYRVMRDLEIKILAYRNRCIKIPDLVGLTYDQSLERTTELGFGASLIQQPEFKALPDYDQRAPLIIYKQDPQPPELREHGFSIKVWVRNDLKSLKVEPSSWNDAKVGETSTFVITAEFLNGEKRVTQDCAWSSTMPEIVAMTSTKGMAKAAGPGKAEIVALYRYHDGMKEVSREVRIPVTVQTPPKPKRELTSFKLHPAGPVDIRIGAPSIQLTGVATFSDKPGVNVRVTRECREWRSDGAPDLKVSDGSVTAHSLQLPPARHRIHTSFTWDGKTMTDSVLFRIVPPDPGTGTGTGTGSTPPSTTPEAQYSKLTLNKSNMTLGMQSKESLVAKVWVAKGTRMFQQEVTLDPALSWSSSNPAIAECAKGVVSSKATAGTCVITATFTPPGAQQPLTAQCAVSVQGDPLIVDFTVTTNGPYKVGQQLEFVERIQAPNKSNYELTWYVQNREVRNAARMQHTFQAPGTYQVRLVARHRNTGVEDAIAKNFDIEHPSDMDVKIGFIPETNVYAIGTSVGFEARVQNAKGITEYRWYVAGEYVGSGRQGVRHKFTEAGEYEIKLGLRMGSNFDEVKVTRMLVVGEAAIGTLGRERNRFEATGAPGNLVIKSSYWKGGTAEWSKPVTFNGGDIGAVDHYILYDGDQADGYNTGFLVYVPRGRNSLLFKVFHFSWADAEGRMPHGTVHYSGPLPLHNESLVPESVQFTRRASRLCEVEWRTRDGSSCRARINKFKKSDKIRFSGVEDLGCQKGVYPPIEDTGDVSGPGVPEDEPDADTGTGELSLPFSDDFSAGLRNWDTQNIKPEWSDGKLFWNEPGHRPLSTRKSIPFENVIIEFDAWCEKDGLPVRWENERGEGYLVVLGAWLNTRSLSGHGPGNVEVVFGQHIVFKKWQHYRIVRQGDNLTASIDGTEVISRKITSRYVGRGTLRFHSYSRVGIDNVRIFGAPDREDDDAGGAGIMDGGGSDDGDDDTLTDDIGGDLGDMIDIADLDDEDTDSDKWGDPGDKDDMDGAGTGGAGGDGGAKTGSGNEEPIEISGAGSGSGMSGESRAVPNIAGLWVDLSGHKVTIDQSDRQITMRALENKGPVGWKTALGKVDGTTADGNFKGWYLTAHISEDGTRITWSNHSVWKRIGSGASDGSGDEITVKPSGISGLYTDKSGHNVHITQDGEKITAEALENKGPVGWKKVNGRVKDGSVNLLFISRVEFAKLSPDGKQILWDNGSVWSCINASPTAEDIYNHSFHAFDMAGVWVGDGHEIRLSQNGEKLTATALENKGPVGWKTASGTLRYWTVSMLFGNRVYTGKVSEDGNHIDWGDVGVWTRQKSVSHEPVEMFIPHNQQGTNELIIKKAMKKRK
jgi:plastocyanin